MIYSDLFTMFINIYSSSKLQTEIAPIQQLILLLMEHALHV